MRNFPTLRKALDSKEFELSSPHAEKLAQIIWATFELLSVEDRQIVVDRLNTATRIITGSRAGDVLGTIVRFLPKRSKWTASEIRQELVTQGIDADQRTVFNAIGYLARKGSIQRLGGGRYLVDGVGLHIPDEQGMCSD